MFGPHFRWEYGLLARWGDKFWAKAVDPVLRFVVGQDDISSLQRIRAAIQLTLLAAVALLPIAPFYNTAHMLTASGLLFDIAGALRLFLLEEIKLKDLRPTNVETSRQSRCANLSCRRESQ